MADSSNSEGEKKENTIERKSSKVQIQDMSSSIYENELTSSTQEGESEGEAISETTEDEKIYFDYKPEEDEEITEDITEDPTEEIKEEKSPQNPTIIVVDQNDENLVTSGTIDALIDRLASVQLKDPQYVYQFLLTYRSFISPLNLLSSLITRYNQKQDIDPKDLNVKQLRIVNCLKLWIEKHWKDFEKVNDNESELLKNLIQFLETTEGPAKTLQKLVTEKQQGQEKRIVRVNSTSSLPPTPFHLPYSQYKKSNKNFSNFSSEQQQFLEFHPVEIARQLTLLEFNIYRTIQPEEFFHGAWEKAKKHETSPNILRMIRHFNEISTWISTLLLEEADPKERVKKLKHILKVAHECQQLHNFNATMEILSGLSAAPVARLKATWAGLKPAYQKIFQDLNSLMPNHFKQLRDRLRASNPPCLPYLGMYLSDLTFIEENPTILSNGLINFDKCRQIARALQEISQFQDSEYYLTLVETISQFITKSSSVVKYNDKEAYDRSLQIEPRESTLKAELSSPSLPATPETRGRRASFIERTYSNSAEPARDDFLYNLIYESPTYSFSETDQINSNIIYGDSKIGTTLIAGTLKKIIERVTSHKTSFERASVIHKLIKCNSCNSKIIGNRYKCLVCKEYDTCETCSNKPFHPNDHIFLRIPTTYSKLPKDYLNVNSPTDLKNLVSLQDQEESQCWECETKLLKDVRFKCLNGPVELCSSCAKLSTPLEDLRLLFIKVNKPLPITLPRIGPQHPSNANALKDRLEAETFLFAYRRFSSPKEVFELLVSRYELPIEEVKLQLGEIYEMFEKKIELPIKEKVIGMLGIWIENYWKLDFSNQPEIISNLQKFLQNSEQKAENPKLKSLISNLLKKVKRRLESIDPQPPTIKKSNSIIRQLKLFELKPENFAQQLCIFTFSIIESLDPLDCLNYIQKRVKNDPAPTVDEFLKKCDQLSSWLSYEILLDQTNEIRNITFLVDVMKFCVNENNFHDASIISIILDSKFVNWNVIPKPVSEVYLKSKGLMFEKNQQKREACTPYIPFMESFFREMTSFDSSTAEVMNGSLIHFSKYWKLYRNIIGAIRGTPFPFAFDNSIQNLIREGIDNVDEEKLKQLAESRLKTVQKLADKFGHSSSSPTLKSSQSVSKTLKKGIGKAFHSVKRQNSTVKDASEKKSKNETKN